MTDQSHRQKRRHPRLPIEMWVEETLGTDTYFQRSGNLSPGGIWLDGTIPHPKGTVVQLKFTLPGDSEPVTVRGEIVGEPKDDRLGMNVKFVGMDEALVERIKKLVERGG